MPRSWIEYWPLQDGSTGLTLQELLKTEARDPKADATRRRNSLLHTFGNLTILTQALNSAVSKSSWDKKKPELLCSSLLPINQQFHSVEKWNEDAIERRSKELFNRAILIWPAPTISE